MRASGSHRAASIPPQGARRSALLRRPGVAVGIARSGFEPDALDRFLVQFDRAFQRGGG